MGRKLYFIALIPDPEIAEEITELKLAAKKYFGTGRALNSPPHVTLIRPFDYAPDDMEEILSKVRLVCRKHSPFHMKLSGFGCFKPRVIFIQPQQEGPLENLYSDLKDALIHDLPALKKEKRNFKAHMTIAFKDLEPKRFPLAWDYFNSMEFEKAWIVKELSLLRYEKHSWKVEKNIPLKDAAKG